MNYSYNIFSSLPKIFVLSLEAIIYISLHAIARPVSGKEICKEKGFTKRHLEPLLQRLVHHDILRGVRGPKGGYLLACERRKLTLAKIYKVSCDIDHYIHEKNNNEDTQVADTIIKPLWKDVEQYIISTLDDVTIEDVCKELQSKGEVSYKPEGDFTI